MRIFSLHGSRTGRTLVVGAVILSALVSTRVASTAAATAPTWVTLPGSSMATPTAIALGDHPGYDPLAITVALQPNNPSAVASELTSLYDPASAQYHRWLATGEFNARFAPSPTQIALVTSYLQGQGLHVHASASPFLVQATGTTAQVESAFNTHISNYLSASTHTPFYANDTSAHVPLALGGVVTSVVGLTDTVRSHPHYITTRAAAAARGIAVPHYGAGPGGSGFTPAQITSIYDAHTIYLAGARGMGGGRTLGLFELSGYTPSDITTYEHTFFGPNENVPLVNVNVDGGPIAPQCPAGDTCNPPADYSGDIEDEADIETQIAVAPKISRILVYNAPNDFTGQTALDEYFKIASDNLADSISSSWGLCEQDNGIASSEAENIAFEQMAAQGQSMFAASGDTGAYGCLRDTGSPDLTSVAVGDPSQPYVTVVGGTSFENFDPGSNSSPTYPAGVETVWNVGNLCNGTPTGLDNCGNYGASTGGNSVFWPRPQYQNGVGVTSSYTQHAPYCSQATAGQACREVPDVSANADEFTPYAEYCTGDPATNSICGSFSASQTPPGWFGIGGTSLSSPLWSAIVVLNDSFHGVRLGNANIALYRLYTVQSWNAPFFHDITGQNQLENNNGLFPVTPGYDEATGIGTPRISILAELL